MRTTVGIAIWVGVIVFAVWALVAGPAAGPAERLTQFATDTPYRVLLELPGEPKAEVGGLVMVPDEERFLRRVGRIAGMSTSGGKTHLSLELFPDVAAGWPGSVDATFVTVPATAGWIVRTLIPASRLEAIRDRWQAFYSSERDAIADSLWPVVRSSLDELFRFYEREVPRILAKHADGFRALVESHRRGAFEKELMPAVQSVAWRVAQAEFSPLLSKIGRELWARLPVMGLGMRYAFEFVPFTNQDQVAVRFKRYLDEDAMPVLRENSGEIVRVLGVVARRTMQDPAVGAAFRKLVGEVIEDPEFFRLLREVAADLTVRNDHLQERCSRISGSVGA